LWEGEHLIKILVQAKQTCKKIFYQLFNKYLKGHVAKSGDLITPVLIYTISMLFAFKYHQ
jgi:hypothetical protein